MSSSLSGSLGTSAADFVPHAHVYRPHFCTTNVARCELLMRCRPKLCQHVAAQLSQQVPQPNGPHIWISDDLLSEAFNRYLRVSHASRRYGSHVPGPLEAKRRSAKRRMGMAAVSAGGGLPPGGDFGALFGATGGSTGWNWEAPGLKLGEPPPLRSAPLERKSALWDWGLRAPEMNAQLELEVDVPHQEVDPVESSRVAFQKLLDECFSTSLDPDQHLDPIFDFLVSSADETEAQNTKQFLQWLDGRRMPSSLLQRLSGLVCDKLKLQTLPRDELLDVLKTLPRLVDWETDESVAQQLRGVYEDFWKFVAGSIVFDTEICFALLDVLRPTMRDAGGVALVLQILKSGFTQAHTSEVNGLLSKNLPVVMSMMFNSPLWPEEYSLAAPEFTKLMGKIEPEPKTLARCTHDYLDAIEGNSARRKATLFWLDCLRECQYDILQVDGVYGVLAKHFQPCDLGEHFAAMTALDFARMLLRVWLPNVSMNTLARDNWKQDHKYLENRQVIDQDEFAMKTLPLLVEDFEALIASSQEHADRDIADGETSNDHPLRLLVYVFARRNLEYDALSELIIRTCVAAYEPKRLHNTFSALWFCSEIRLKTTAIASIAEHFLTIGETSRAVSIILRVPSITPESYPLLYVKVIKTGMFWHARAFRCLLRSQARVPSHKRTIYKLSVPEQHVDAVHLMAHAYANSGDNIRVAYRAVWNCYRYLQDRGAPLSPLLSRALVQAGLTRPLGARIPVPEERINFILGLVGRIEGEDVARQVEEIVRQMSQGTYAKIEQKQRTEGMRLIARERKATLFRLKTWATPKTRRAERLDVREPSGSYKPFTFETLERDDTSHKTDEVTTTESAADKSLGVSLYQPVKPKENFASCEADDASTTATTGHESLDIGLYKPFTFDEREVSLPGDPDKDDDT